MGEAIDEPIQRFKRSLRKRPIKIFAFDEDGTPYVTNIADIDVVLSWAFVQAYEDGDAAFEGGFIQPTFGNCCLVCIEEWD